MKTRFRFNNRKSDKVLIRRKGRLFLVRRSDKDITFDRNSGGTEG